MIWEIPLEFLISINPQGECTRRDQIYYCKAALQKCASIR